jgi:hypothetical protein
MADTLVLPDLNLPDKQSPARLSFMKVSGENPDRAAQIQTISKRTGNAPPLIADNLDKAKQATAYGPEFWKDIESKYPGTSKWAAVPANMAIAHDDIENLTNIEDTHSTFKNKFKAMGGAVGGMVQATGGIVSALGSLDRYVLGDEQGGFQKKVGADIADYGKKMVEYYGIQDPTFADKLVGAATSSAVFFIPGMGIARGAMALSAMPRLAAFAGAGLSAAFESAIEAGAVHESMRAKGATDNESLAAASKTFAANMVLNTGLNYAGGLFGKILPKGKTVLSQGSAVKQAVKGIGKAGAAEGIQEGSQQVISNVFGEEQDTMVGVWESAILGGIVGGGMASVMDIGNTIGEQKRAVLSKEYIEKSAETYAASKLGTRSKDTLNTLVDAQAVPVHISPEVFDTYFQSQNIDPIQAATELGALESYTEAKKLGVGKMEIKQSAFVGKDMDTHRAALLNDITLNPEAATFNEAQERIKEYHQTIKDMSAESDKLTAENPAIKEAHDTIFEDFKQALTLAGEEAKGTKKSIDQSAKIAADSFITQATRRGVDPIQFYNEKKPQIFGGGTPEQGQMFQGEVSPYATNYKPRGGWTIDKIHKHLKQIESLKSEHWFTWDREVSKYDNAKDLEENLFYHGTGGYVSGGLKSGASLPKGGFRGSGYDYDLHTISLSKSKNVASNFSGTSNHGTVYPVLLRKEAKVISMPEISDSNELEDILPKLFSDGVDAVKIGDWKSEYSEKEIAILNPRAIVKGGTGEGYAAFNKEKFINEDAKEMWENAVENPRSPNILFQSPAESFGKGEPLASYSKTKQGAVIKMFKGANASSFLHEMSHFWLDDIHDFVKSGKADESYLKDWKLIQDYVGHETGKELTTEQHEKFATSFEKYLLEGKAPSVELQGAFAKLKNWMVKIYESGKRTLGIEITPEIRGVFDRLIATDKAIEEARAEIGTESGKVEGLEGEALKARQMAESMLLKPLMDEMSKANQEKMAVERIRLTGEAETTLKADPVYGAIDDIIQDNHKIGEKVTEQMIRNEADKYILGELSEEKAAIYEIYAENNKLSSGDELLKKIASSDKRETALKNMVDAGMKPLEAMNAPATLKDNALKALHEGDGLGRLLALEAQVLDGMRMNKDINAELSAERRAQASREWEQIKVMAADTLGNKNIKEAGKFRTYYTLERKAAEKVGKATAKKDYEAASKAKREQMVSHALAAEAVRISDNTDKVLRQVHKIALKDKTLFKEEKNFNQVADLLAKYGFYNRRDYSPASKVETLKGWADRVGNTMSLLNEDGSIIDGSSLVTIPEWILTDSKVLPYGKLSVNEFLDVTDTIKHIVHIGNIQDNAFKVGGGKAIKIIVEDLIAQGSRAMPADRPREVEPGRFAQADRWVNDYMGGIKRMDTMVWELDGMKDNGPWRDYFIKSQYRQANYESNKRFEMKNGMEALWKAYDKKELKAMFEKKVFYDEIGKSMTRQRLIAMALNIGAKENRTKLFENVPYGMEGAANWNEQTVMAMLQKHLTKKDWQFVQGTWDLIGKLWPETVTLSEEMTGFKPGKVESVAFEVIADGEKINMPGGYYPLRADPRASALAAQREVSTAPLYTDLNPAWKQGVRHGHTEKRTNAQYAVALDLTTIDRHLSEVTHDLAFRALCHDFNRILNNKDMQGFLRNKMGDSGLNFFRNYAASIAAGGNAEKLAQDGMSSMVRDLNSRISTAVILGRVSVLTQNLANPFLAINAVEGFTAYDVAKGMLSKGMGNYWVKATTNWKAQKVIQEQVFSLSSFMRDKFERPDYSLSDMKENRMNNFLGGMIAGSDNLTNIPLWLEAYEKKMNQTGKSEEAVAYADLLINRISGSGRKYDQAKMTRGSDIERLVTKFYSFWNIEYQNWIRNVKSELKDPLHNTPAFLGFVASRAMFSYLSAILVGKGPFGDDDDENKKFWIAPLRDPVQFFPGARDIVNVGIDQSLGLKSYGYRAAPVAGVAENFTRLIPKIKKGEPEAIAEGITKAMSIGIPGITPAYPDQFNVWFWNAYDYAVNDMEFQVSDITKRRPVRER